MTTLQDITLVQENQSKATPIAQAIAIASGKGGVGKTWISITLSHILAQQKRHVLLFDADLGLANIDIQLGLLPSFDLASVLNGKTTLLQTKTFFDEGGFDIIAGPSGSGCLADLGDRAVQTLTQSLRVIAPSYDHVIIDLAAGVHQANLHFLHSSAHIVVVITHDPTSITDAYALIKLLIKTGSTPDIGVIVNMADNEKAAQQTFATLQKACESFLKLSPRFLGYVRRDSKVNDAIRRQTPIILRHPNCSAVEDLEKIVNNIGLYKK